MTTKDSWKGLQMMATEALKAVREAGEQTQVGKNAMSEAQWAVKRAREIDDRPVKWTKGDR